MSSQMGINSVTFAKNAIKYTQGEKIQKDSFAKELLSGAKSSALFAGVFQAPTILYGIKHRKEYGGFTNALDAREKAKGVTEAGKKAEELANGAKEAGKKVGLISRFKNSIKNAKSFLGEKTGITKLTSAFATKFPKATKFLKGTGGMLAINAVLSTITDVIPAFKNGGFGEGMKQVGKTAVYATTNAVAWTAGMKLGASIGAACGPLGSIVGGIAGMVLGGVVSSIAEKGIEKIIGKNFSEKYAEEQEEAQAQAIANDPASMQQLQAGVAQMIAEDQADGKISQDTEEMISELNQLQASGGNTSFGSLTTGVQNPTTYSTGYQTPTYSTEYQTSATNYTQASQPTVTTALNNYQTTPTQQLNMTSVASGVNQGVRTNISNQQSNGIYELNNIPKDQYGNIDHSIYQITPNMLQA